MLEKLKNGLIVSCYASSGDMNHEMANPLVMAHIAHSVEVGGAKGIRTNLENISEIKKMCNLPVIGIKKIAKDPDGFDTGDFRITPTLKEVEDLVEAGADAVAIDATRRERYDNLTLGQFINKIKEHFNIPVIADISDYDEAINAINCGADAVGTTLSGYMPYSKNKIKFGTVPSPGPDYELIKKLAAHKDVKIIAEGRFKHPKQARRALDLGAFAVVVGTAITMPKKIAEDFVLEMSK